MSIADNLSRILTGKKSLRSSIRLKNVTIDDTDSMDSYSSKISSIVTIDNNDYYSILDNLISRSSVSISFPSDFTAIRSYCLYNYSSLQSLVIPVSVTELGSYAFSGCTGLTTIYFNCETVSDLGTNLWGDSMENYTGHQTADKGTNKLYIPYSSNLTESDIDSTLHLFDPSWGGFTLIKN